MYIAAGSNSYSLGSSEWMAREKSGLQVHTPSMRLQGYAGATFRDWPGKHTRLLLAPAV